MFSNLPNYVMLDLESTGATPLYDRITEIALIRFEYGVETERWQTLVNPGISIPLFITHLTGITNEMVKDAPTFEEVAHTLYGHIEGRCWQRITCASTMASSRANIDVSARC